MVPGYAARALGGVGNQLRDSKEAKCREKQWWSHRNLTYDLAYVRRADSDSQPTGFAGGIFLEATAGDNRDP